MKETFRPDYPPLYGHHIDPPFIAKCTGEEMPDILALGIDARHSNEDQIAPFTEWIDLYGDQIGLFGGFDMNELILNPYDHVCEKMLREGSGFRARAHGYGPGSGDSIPGYMSVDGFEAMVAAVKEIRAREAAPGNRLTDRAARQRLNSME